MERLTLAALVAANLLAGNLSPTLREQLTAMLDRVAQNFPDNPAALVAETIYFVITSPEYAYQR